MPRSTPVKTRIRDAAPIFAALGDETRLALLQRLRASGRLSVTQLSEGSPITRQAVTKHLSVLAGAGLVRDTRQGRERLWEFEAKRLHDAQHYLEEISKGWDNALDRLKKFVES